MPPEPDEFDDEDESALDLPEGEDDVSLLEEALPDVDEADAQMEYRSPRQASHTLISKGGHINVILSENVELLQGWQRRELSDKEQKHLPVEEWYAAAVTKNDHWRAALIAAIAFIPKGPSEFIFAQAERLAQLAGFNPDPTFTRDSSIRAVGAAIGGSESRITGNAIESVVFVRTNRDAEARRFLWEQARGMHGALCAWLVELGKSVNEELSLRVGTAIGDLACDAQLPDGQLAKIFKLVIEPWAQEGSHARNALGAALSMMRSDARASGVLAKRLRRWTASANKGSLKAAITVCRSDWGVLCVDQAMGVLKRALSMGREKEIYKDVQVAITRLWLFEEGDTHERLAAGAVLEGLLDWSSPRSIFSWAPQRLFVNAFIEELKTSVDIPCVLESAEWIDSSLADTAAMLLEIGLAQGRTRQHLSRFLEQLRNNAIHGGYRDAFDAFLQILAIHGADLPDSLRPPKTAGARAAGSNANDTTPDVATLSPPSIQTPSRSPDRGHSSPAGAYSAAVQRPRTPPPPTPISLASARVLPTPRRQTTTQSERPLAPVTRTYSYYSPTGDYAPRPPSTSWRWTVRVLLVGALLLAVLGVVMTTRWAFVRGQPHAIEQGNPEQIALNREEQAWSEIQRSTDLIAVGKFVRHYPASERRGAAVALAREQIERLRYGEQGQSVTIGAKLWFRAVPEAAAPRSEGSRESATYDVYAVIRINGEDWYVFQTDGSWPFVFVPWPEVHDAQDHVTYYFSDIESAPTAPGAYANEFPGTTNAIAPEHFVPPVRLEGPEALDNFYPRRARDRDQEGLVRVAVLVSSRGEVADVQLRGENPQGYGFGEAAERYAWTFRFEPATQDGVPQDAWYETSVRFRLK